MEIINKIKNLFRKSNKYLKTNLPNRKRKTYFKPIDLNNDNLGPETTGYRSKNLPRLSEKQILRNHRIAKVMFRYGIDPVKAREYLRIKQIEERTKKIRVKKKQLKRIQKLFGR